MLSTQLRSEYADISEILAKNIDHIKDLYNQCLEACLDQIEPDESHLCFCTLITVALLNDQEKIQFPMNYFDEDEKLMADIMSQINLLLTVEAMADKGMISRKYIDGELHYTLNDNSPKDLTENYLKYFSHDSDEQDA